MRRGVAQSPVETSPTFGFDFLLQGRSNFQIATRTKFQRDTLFRAGSKSPADVVAADNEIPTVIGTPTDQDMDVGIVGIPVIDCDPVDLGAEIPFRIRHQFARERPEITHFGCILRRDDEAEVVAILLTSAGKRALVGHVGPRIEQTGVSAIARYAIPLQVSDMPGERRRAESISAMPDHSHLDHDPTRRRAE